MVALEVMVDQQALENHLGAIRGNVRLGWPELVKKQFQVYDAHGLLMGLFK